MDLVACRIELYLLGYNVFKMESMLELHVNYQISLRQAHVLSLSMLLTAQVLSNSTSREFRALGIFQASVDLAPQSADTFQQSPALVLAELTDIMNSLDACGPKGHTRSKIG